MPPPLPSPPQPFPPHHTLLQTTHAPLNLLRFPRKPPFASIISQPNPPSTLFILSFLAATQTRDYARGS